MSEAEANTRRTTTWRDLAMFFALAGVLHFVGSLAEWVLFYIGSYRQGWKHVLTVSYAATHVPPAMVLLGLFAWASLNIWRRRRFAVPFLMGLIALSLVAFAIEARREPQFERVWIDDPTACTNRQSYYCTWWWYQPTRH